jgi:hypothetical protein
MGLWTKPPPPSPPEAAFLHLRDHVSQLGASALGRKLSPEEATQATGSVAALVIAGGGGGLYAAVAGSRRRAALAAEAERQTAAKAGGALGATLSAAVDSATPHLQRGLRAVAEKVLFSSFL